MTRISALCRHPLVAALAAAGCLCFAPPARAAEPETPEPVAQPPRPKTPYKKAYVGYKPPFLAHVTLPSEKRMKLSTERSFFTLNMIQQDARANALVKAALAREQQGRYRDALKMYQMIIDRYPNELHRVSRYGVFVPISQYCQRRILNFPPSGLEHYRTLHDARAREAFEQARRKHSLIGLSEVVDNMLATSFGSKAIAELGNAALDSGHHLAALEHFKTIRSFFPESDSRSRELDLKIAYCRRMLGEKDTGTGGKRTPADRLPPAMLTRLQEIAKTARPERAPFHSQLSSASGVAADDYTLFPPTVDPIALTEPVWKHPLEGSRNDFFVFSQPVVTKNSVIYRYKNIVYCHSILNGELRWVYGVGGRATWQNRNERQYPQEDLIVQDGLVFTVISKGGPSLVAIDEVTGLLRWAYGPMVASTEEEARMRFEAAPAGGPRTIYTGYVLDNIEGDTHTDSEYGVIAFESTNGRVLWRKEICRMAPGKFSAGFAVQRRNRIRSFISPPLYHQGTVYYNTNAGAVAALDSRSGRIKWLTRYPYLGAVHDATRHFGRGGDFVQYTRIYFTPHSPMFWYNQRPLLMGERLYVLPVDAGYMMCVDRRTGRVQWTKSKGLLYDTHSWRRVIRVNGNSTYLLGALKTGELVFAHSFQSKPVQLVDAKTGATLWPIVQKHLPSPKTTHSVERETSPSMSLGTPSAGLGRHSSVPMNGAHYELGARPLLTTDGKLHLAQWNYLGWPIFAWTSSLCSYDLVNRKVLQRRRYYSGRLLGYVHRSIHTWAPEALKAHEDLPHKDARVEQWIKNLRLVVKDTVPTNPHGPFLPFSRVTFRRYGEPFELRFGARDVGIVFDRKAVAQALSKRSGPDADFAKAELAFADAEYGQSAGLLRRCLGTMSSEDVDFRATVNQLLFRIHRRLARSGVRSGDGKKELDNCLGMSRTATTLPDEIETLFALSEAYERQGNLGNAARCLRSVISTYGHHEYPVPEIAALESEDVLAAAGRILDKGRTLAGAEHFRDALNQSLNLMKRGLPLYLSTVSPLPKRRTVRAGELAAARLIRLQKLPSRVGAAEPFAKEFERVAGRELAGKPVDEQLYRLWEFPGTAAAQKALSALAGTAAAQKSEAGRRTLWQLADAARVCALKVPEAHRKAVSAPPPPATAPPVRLPARERSRNIADAEGINWLVLQRHGDHASHPGLLFIGGRVRKRLDNKFILRCFDLNTGRMLWEVARIRLKGTGQEPGFFRAFVHGNIVVVNGLSDALAYDIRTGNLLWRYRTPFNFETKSATISGNLLVLGGKTETIALHVATTSPTGEVAWRVTETGDQYLPPHFHKDRLVSIRKMPFSVGVRYRATGRLIGRLALPDLSLHTVHPLVEKGPRTLPFVRFENLLVVSDGWYYILIDIDRMQVVWRRLIDQNDLTREPAMRFALNRDYLAVIKEDYDQKVIYMLSARTGDVLWHTDPKDANSPQPIHSMAIQGERLYGIGVHAGQGFYFVGMSCRTGARAFRTEVVGYESRPKVELLPENYGGHAVVKVQDRQDFELKVFSFKDGSRLHTLKRKGVGPFGVHGRVSAAVQHGRLIFLSKDQLGL